MDTLIVALIVIAAVLAVLNSLVKTFRSGGNSPGGCGCSCSGCDEGAKPCADPAGSPERIA